MRTPSDDLEYQKLIEYPEDDSSVSSASPKFERPRQKWTHYDTCLYRTAAIEMQACLKASLDPRKNLDMNRKSIGSLNIPKPENAHNT